MSKANPDKFSDLNADALKAAAEFYGTDETVDPKVIIADLAESGVTWDLYAKDFLTPVEEVPVVEPEPAVVTSDQVTGKEETVSTVVEEVVTVEPSPVFVSANYLIKMERENPYFEFGTYKFTKENPYNIMPASDAQRILTDETGFRQAFPAELQEYYS